MHPAAAPEFQELRTKMESDWTPQMMQLLGIDAGSLPIIWDADFLLGAARLGGPGHLRALRNECQLRVPVS